MAGFPSPRLRINVTPSEKASVIALPKKGMSCPMSCYSLLRSSSDFNLCISFAYYLIPLGNIASPRTDTCFTPGSLA